ncbi:histidine phosphatase family protein [Micrococcoides hystricis]|uniref:Histidine phosphatase family protein n=1 Tax=Micrococcoides hystricis TaxID=1572761 RepID=A0ABV6PFC5_9MICC
MTSITVHLLRHGEVHNPDRVLYGRLPGFGLSELGEQMAERIADYFVDRQRMTGKLPVVVGSSPLQRAQETATPLAERLGLPIRTDERLLEAENQFEGLSNVKSRLKDPRLWPLLRNPFRPSWGEPYRAQVARMVKAIHEAHAQAYAAGGDGAEAVLVSHQLPIWVTRLAAEGAPLWHDPRQRECTLTSLTSFGFESGRLARVDYAEPNAELLKHAANLPGA